MNHIEHLGFRKRRLNAEDIVARSKAREHRHDFWRAEYAFAHRRWLLLSSVVLLLMALVGFGLLLLPLLLVRP